MRTAGSTEPGCPAAGGPKPWCPVYCTAPWGSWISRRTPWKVRLAWKNLQHHKRHCNTLQAATVKQVRDKSKTSVMRTATYLRQSHRGVAELSILTLQHLAWNCHLGQDMQWLTLPHISIVETTGRWRSYNSTLRLAMLRDLKLLSSDDKY
jgi:hypothetical protein